MFDDIVPELCLQLREVNINLIHLSWMIIRYVELHIHTITLPKQKKWKDLDFLTTFSS